jgi:hypothetical protein
MSLLLERGKKIRAEIDDYCYFMIVDESVTKDPLNKIKYKDKLCCKT